MTIKNYDKKFNEVTISYKNKWGDETVITKKFDGDTFLDLLEEVAYSFLGMGFSKKTIEECIPDIFS